MFNYKQTFSAFNQPYNPTLDYNMLNYKRIPYLSVLLFVVRLDYNMLNYKRSTIVV